MRVTLFDYGAGNLHSLAKALAGDDTDVRLERDPAAALATDVLVLPGVGAFGPAAAALAPARERVRDSLAAGLPCIAICLGMQLLFDGSDEGPGLGVGLVPGRVRALRARRVPHMGWNEVRPVEAGAAVPAPPPLAYFAHSFACAPDEPSRVSAWTTHEDDRFPAVVRVANTVGVQFHPEKSSAAGVAFLRALLAGARAGARAVARGGARP